MNFSQSILVAAIGALSLTATHQAQAFNPAADLTTNFSSTPSNPNGVWSYGYNDTATFGYNFKPLTQVTPNPNLQGWHDPLYSNAGSTPTVANYSGSTPPSWIATGQMMLHPGPAQREDEAILRFTAPSTTLYTVSLTLLSGDSGETEGWVVLNNNFGTPLASMGITSLNPNYSNGTLALAAGDTLDVVVGNFNGNFNFDSTPIQMSISAVPEVPASAMLLAGLAAMGTLVRRMKRPAD